MFQGWRVRIVCLAVGEGVLIPAEEFENYSVIEAGTVAEGEIPIMGKKYHLTVQDTGVIVRRVA